MKRLFIISSFLLLIMITTAEITSSGGKAGATGSPGETTCDIQGCHNSYALNSGTGSMTITSSNMTNWEYLPGQTYQISVTVSQAGANPFGFDFEALKVSDNTSAGTIVVTNSSETQLLNATVSGKVRANITHQLNGGATNNTHSFNFEWIAPGSDAGYIKFYAAGNAANGDGTPFGDYIYSTSQLIGGPSTVGVHDLTPSSCFSIYPNPMHSDCTIRFVSSVKESKCEIQLLTIAGEIVQSESNLQISGNEISDFKIADNLASGIYFMRLIANGNASVQKMIVSKN